MIWADERGRMVIPEVAVGAWVSSVLTVSVGFT